MICPGCGRDRVTSEDGFMAAPDDVCWWPTCECGYPSFATMFGIILPPETSGAGQAFDENGWALPDGPMTFRTPGAYR